MMTHSFARILVPAFLFFLVGTAGCGGGGNKELTESETLSACDPSSALPGTKVTCHVDKEFNDACTVFFGNSPLEAGETAAGSVYAFNEEDGTIELIVPNIVFKTQDITYCCGDCDEKSVIAKAFKLEAGKSSGGSTGGSGSSGTGGTSGTGGEDILPGGGTGGTTGGSGDSTADDDGDGIPNVTDSCPGTPSGASVNGSGCSASQESTPSGPASAVISKFEVTPAGSAKLSTYKIMFQYSNAKAAHLWGNIFNREASDDGLPENEQCGKVGDRYLLTKNDGSTWAGNEGATNYKDTNVESLSTGQVCQGQDPASNGCKWKAPGSVSLLPSTSLENRDLYFYEFKKIQDGIKEMQITQIGPYFQQEVEENPNCRINLNHKNGGALITSDSGTVYTRSLVHYGKVCLAVQGMDDQWKIQCLTKNAQEPSLKSFSAELNKSDLSSSGYPFVAIDFTVKDASGPAVIKRGKPGQVNESCKITDKPDAGEEATGTYAAQCELLKGLDGQNARIHIEVPGIGSKNKEEKDLMVVFPTPSLKFKLDGNGGKTDDYQGDVKLKWEVSRDYSIKDDDEDGATTYDSGKAHWVKEIKFKENNTVKNGETKANSKASYGHVTLTRSHDIFTWKAECKDFDGKSCHKVDGAQDSWPYEYSFTFTNVKPPKCQYDDECCNDTLERARDGQIKVKGKNLKSVVCTCDNGLEKRDPNVLTVNEETDTIDATVQWDWGSCSGRDDDIHWNCSCTGEFLGPDENGNTSKTHSWSWCCEGDDFNESEKECHNGDESGDYFVDC